MRLDPVELGPWPSGLDNYNRKTARVFQVGGESAARLAEAVNVDLDDEGWPARRSGLSEVFAVGEGLNAYSGEGINVYQDGAHLWQVRVGETVSRTLLVNDLDPRRRVEFVGHAGKVFWSNGEVKGLVAVNGPSHWGLPIAPTPTLSVGAGELRAGRYLVAVAWVDAAGLEHCASDSAAITLETKGGISVSVPYVDTYAVQMRVFVTPTNGFELYKYETRVASTAPFVIDVPFSTQADTSSFVPLRTQEKRPPVAADLLGSMKGFLLLGQGGYVYPSVGHMTHLFDYEVDVQEFPGDVIGLEGLDSGFWVATDDGAFWTSGAVPSAWNSVRGDDRYRKYAAGSVTVSGTHFPRLGSAGEVAVFLSSDGPVFGLGDGQLVVPYQSQLKLDVEGRRVTFAFVKRNAGSGDRPGFYQLVWSLGVR